MARFQKTRIRAASAVCFLLALYAMAGMAYSAFKHSPESIAIWATIAIVASVVGVAYHLYIIKKGRPAP